MNSFGHIFVDLISVDLVSEEKAFRDIFKQQSKHINEDHEEIANSVVD